MSRTPRRRVTFGSVTEIEYPDRGTGDRLPKADLPSVYPGVTTARAGLGWWLAYGVVALAIGLTFAVAGAAVPEWRPGVVVVGLSGVVAVATALRRSRARGRWVLVALGLFALVAADVLTHDCRTLFGGPLPYPWLGQLPAFAGFLLAAAALVAFARARSRGRSRAALIDALVVTTPLVAISWAFLIDPLATRDTAAVSTKLVSVAYPVVDIVLACAVAYLVFGPGTRRLPSLGLLLAGVGALLVGDVLHSWAVLHPGELPADTVRQASRVACCVLLGTAAMHPSAGNLSKPASLTPVRPSRLRLGVLLGAASVVPVLISAGARPPSGLTPLAASTAVVFLLICMRLLELAGRHEADVQRAAVLAQASEGLVEARTVPEITAVADKVARRLLGPTATVTIGNGDRVPSGSVRVPIKGRRESHGSLIVAASEPIEGARLDALRALADSVALALDRVLGSEQLLRRRTDARFEALVQHSSDAVLVLDAAGCIDYASASTAHVLGTSPDELHGTSFLDLVVDYDRPRVSHALETRFDDSPVQPFEFELTTSLGTFEVEATCTNLLHTDAVRGIVMNIRDVSERKEFERRLAHQAFHDDLTGLANRVLFRDRVEHALARVQRGLPIAVLLVDLDDFKSVNDTLGHQAGDELIRVVAERLAGTARDSDTAARLGGDEFAVLIEDDSADNSELVAKRILDAIAIPIHLDGRTFAVTASIGIARAQTGDESDADLLLRNADVAMYAAKASAKGSCRVFSSDMHTAFLGRMQLKRELQAAIESNALELRYQPVVDLETGDFVSLEALVRWNHPTRGYVSPDEFIPIAEESGAIVALGRWALKTACEKGARLGWIVGPRSPTISVNLSGRQLQEPTLVSDTMQVLSETGLAPEKLVLEVTETAMISDFDLALSRLRDLRASKIRVAVDDFGSGYSSLNYIRRLPIDVLKIDRAFIAEIGESPEVVALTKTILDLAAIIGVVAVAEGIETVDQLATLRELGCARGQGYLFMAPVTGEEIEEAVAAQVRARRDPAAVAQAGA